MRFTGKPLEDFKLQAKAEVGKPPRFAGQAPTASEDLQRILALPRRPVPTEEVKREMAAIMTGLLRRENPNCRCKELRPYKKKDHCILALNPTQGWYLMEAAEVRGAAGHVVAGGGKTGIDLLLPMVFPWTEEELRTGRARAVLLIPPELRSQLRDDYELWSQHFKLPNLAGGPGPHIPGRPTLDVVAYSQISNPNWATWFKANKPRLIIEDEAQNLKDKSSVRTDRFLRYFIETEEDVASCAHSGTLTTHSPDDYAHLTALALREGSPLPLDTGTLQAWCAVLAPQSGKPTPIGALSKLCLPGEPVRSGFRRRLLETKGIISTEDAQVEAKLVIHERVPPPMPPGVQEAMRVARETKRPIYSTGSGEFLGAEELSDDMQRAAVAKQVASGFAYYWKYPRGESEELIDRWFAARKLWNGELGARMDHRSDLMDSPALLREAAERALAGYWGPLPVWHSKTLVIWKAIENEVQPEESGAWISDWLAQDAARWGNEAPGVIWYVHDMWGRKVADLGDFTFYEGGDAASEGIRREAGDRTIVASLKAHHFGKNLQMFHRALIESPPAGAGVWEQLLARHHRPGQEAPQVDFHVYLHTEELRNSFDRALEFARYCQETTGKNERILFADHRLTS